MANVDSNQLNQFLSTLSRAELSVAIDKICDICLIPRTKFHNWRQGHARIEPLYKVKIEEFFNAKIFSDINN